MNEHWATPLIRDSRRSGIHAAEPRVYVLVMCLEPIAKCGPQHASRGARRRALHHKMFAIEKISRVAGIERESIKSRERTENSGSPLPSISQHVVHAESAASRRKSIYRRRIPMVEIKVAESRIRRYAAPRVDPLGSIHRAIGGAMPLLFCRKRLPRPARVGHGFGMTHVNWPVQRQRNLFKHPAV